MRLKPHANSRKMKINEKLLRSDEYDAMLISDGPLFATRRDFESSRLLERRMHPRYAIQEPAIILIESDSSELTDIENMSMGEIGIAVFRSKPSEICRILDISLNGAAFHFPGFQNFAKREFYVDILKADGGIYINDIKVIKVSDDTLGAPLPSGSFDIRKMAVRFINLTSHQLASIDTFITHHAARPL